MLLTAVFSPFFVFSFLFIPVSLRTICLSHCFSAHLPPFFFFFTYSFTFLLLSLVLLFHPLIRCTLLIPLTSRLFFVLFSPLSLLPLTITSSRFGFKVKKRFSRVESLAACASFACRLKDAPFLSDCLISFYVICYGNCFLAIV